MTTYENVAKVFNSLSTRFISRSDGAHEVETIRARLVELEAENERLRSDRDSWCDQASQRVADWDGMRKRAEKAEALLHDASRYLDPRHYSEIIKRITAHLSENGHG